MRYVAPEMDVSGSPKETDQSRLTAEGTDQPEGHGNTKAARVVRKNHVDALGAFARARFNQ